MRNILLAAICIGGLFTGAAQAQQWSDPAGRITFSPQPGWATTVERSDTFTYVVSGSANNECHFLARPNQGTAAASPATARRTAANDAQFGQDQWVRVANSLTPVFPANSAQFISRSTDSSGFWPIQRAELSNGERAVHGAIQIRPGVDLIAMCLTYGGADSAETYDAIIRSFGTPNDAALQTTAEAAEAAAAAAAAAPAPEPEPARRRN